MTWDLWSLDPRGSCVHHPQKQRARPAPRLSRYLRLGALCSGGSGGSFHPLFWHQRCPKGNWDMLNILRVYLGKNLFESGSIWSNWRQKGQKGSCGEKQVGFCKVTFFWLWWWWWGSVYLADDLTNNADWLVWDSYLGELKLIKSWCLSIHDFILGSLSCF